ncbi:FMN-dependent NADPH-azoreductase [Corynebacterium occultum]|uniref:FMN-dependent NADPH-azoreductase n=1 Tax=Corynebacterium occultum TaxID=2675219 RepID=A0A6B8VUL8_9CORY|nr:NAD(P)H-dependent oxidoreductase [Corynebacterium occultum]QGU06809.1 FMN-dependent NADPH-azoreductase [Corynebacterium occultum]
MKIGIIIGSVREGRFGEAVGKWVLEGAQARGSENFDYEIIDLLEFNVPLLTSGVVPGAANKQYDDPNVQAWSKAIDGVDGFVFVTPEYNHGVPGPMKNAYDSLGSEWFRKPVGFVGYGASNAIRAIEQWRQIVSNFAQIDVRNQVELSIFADADEEGFAPGERRAGELEGMLNSLEEAVTIMNR